MNLLRWMSLSFAVFCFSISVSAANKNTHAAKQAKALAKISSAATPPPKKTFAERIAIENRQRELANRRRRELVALPMNGLELEKVSTINKPILDRIANGNCQKMAGTEKGLKGFKVHFEDGTKGPAIITASESLGKSSYRITMYESIVGFSERTVRFKNGKTIWTGLDGKDYPVEKFTLMTQNEVVESSRPANIPAEISDTCLFKNRAGLIELEDEFSTSSIE